MQKTQSGCHNSEHRWSRVPRFVLRLALYLLGLFITAFGINLSIKSNLGVTPVSVVNVSVSDITGISLGTVTVAIYVCYVLAQFLLLGRGFRLKNLLQLGFSFAFGLFLDLSGMLLQTVEVNTYWIQLAWMTVGLIVISFGAMLFISMDIVPNAPDGIVLAIGEKSGTSFSRVKFLFDIGCVVLAAALYLIFIGRISSIREGTVLSALLTGRLIGVFGRAFNPFFQRTVFGGERRKAVVN